MSGSITIYSNLSSLTAQRRLFESTSMLSKPLSRLSSGLRINRAGDDAAGLAVSESLRADTRVFTQGIRNLNDAVSLLQIAEGALQELSGILIRQGELAEQAANGTLSLGQRRALDEEANALRDEFNRVVASAEFNNRKLLDLSVSSLRVQAGYGMTGSLSLELGRELSRIIGNTTFGGAISQTASSWMQDLIIKDFDSDGNLDALFTGGTLHLGNGDGSFKAGAALPAGGSAMAVGEFNGDGLLDIAVAVGDLVGILIGDGAGVFSIGSMASVDSDGGSIAVADLNGDGLSDLATSHRSANTVNILFGHGDGSFGVDLGGGSYRANASYKVGTTPYSIAVGDFNGDGAPDLATGNDGQAAVSVLINGGNGSFRSAVSYAAVATQTSIAVGDLNADGIDDIVAVNDMGRSVHVLLGNDNGSFRNAVSYDAHDGPWGLALGDLNGDSILDIVTANYGSIDCSTLIGRGDGTFESATDTALIVPPDNLALGDFNNDGALDAVTGGAAMGSLETHLGDTIRSTAIGRLNLNTRAYALQTVGVIKAAMMRVNSQLCSIGAVQSRLATAISVLQQSTENYVSAQSRVTDADIADDSALLLKAAMLQEAGVAVLGQANQGPALALLVISSM